MNRELICYILKSYVPPIGSTVRKQPQRTNRYAVVSKRVLNVLCTSIIYNPRDDFSHIGRSFPANRESICHES